MCPLLVPLNKMVCDFRCGYKERREYVLLSLVENGYLEKTCKKRLNRIQYTHACDYTDR